MQVMIMGSSPQTGFYWGVTNHDGFVGGCRSTLMNLTPGVRLYLRLESGTTWSDIDSKSTSLNVFRLERRGVSSAACDFSAFSAFLIAGGDTVRVIEKNTFR